jgi:hypothetical protein
MMNLRSRHANHQAAAGERCVRQLRLPRAGAALAVLASALALLVPAAAAALPRPDHVVVVVMENHSYNQVIGAPYISGLAGQGASFTSSYAIGHPSQPNYLALFSGSDQGVGDDNCGYSFNAPNLGSELISAGLTFTGFSEDMPSAGYTGCDTGNYAHRHNPWVQFTNVPASSNLTFSSFPSNYAALPTVSFVIPNLCNDMHDCDVATGDDWLRAHIDAYAQWAKSHNSLLVLTWDEDDDSSGNQIATIFVGAGVKPGNYGERIDHYSVLRTIEDMYGLGHAGNSASAAPVTDIWAAAGGGGGGTGGGGGSGGGHKKAATHHRSPIRLALGRLSLRTLVRTRQLPVRVFAGRTCAVSLTGSLRLAARGRAHWANPMALPFTRLVFRRSDTHAVNLGLAQRLTHALLGERSVLVTLSATCRNSSRLTSRATLHRVLH